MRSTVLPRGAAILLASGALFACSEPAGDAARDGGASATSAAARGAGDGGAVLEGGTPGGGATTGGGAATGGGADAPAATPAPPLLDEELYPESLLEAREALFRRMVGSMRITDAQLSAVREIFEGSPVLGQGNPANARYAMTRRECREIRAAAGVVEVESPACGAPFMSPVFDRAGGEGEADARACVDRYEFPGIPCEHPVVWATARDAAALCAAVGKRLCDAHEWEGACAGSVRKAEAEYAFGKSRKDSRRAHNREREVVWAYGAEKDHARCATASRKTKGCTSGGWKPCGSNTYPSGAFPGCASPFGVHDLHGNVAEHMNLPTRPEELQSAGGAGYTEMKGSWFIFSGYEPHEDDCRWRAPDWHATKLMDRKSHANYHLGFRCCKSVP